MPPRQVSPAMLAAMLIAVFCVARVCPAQDRSASNNAEDAKLVEELNRQRLPAVFAFNFASDGFDEQFFAASDASLDNIQQRRDGLFTWIPGKPEKSFRNVALKFQLVGDFDIEATFEQLKMTGNERAFVGLTAELKDEQKLIPRILRTQEVGGDETVRVSMTKVMEGKRRLGKDKLVPCTAASGTLRLSRRGKMIYYLIAEEDSEAFRLVGRREAADHDSITRGVRLLFSAREMATVAVVWKDIRLSAEKLLQVPPPQPNRGNSLYTMSLADRKLRKLADPKPGMKSLGSPEWSSDGKKIVCDMSNGGVATSRVVIMNADGSDFHDLGPGCMPSLSADGTQIAYTVSGEGIKRMDADGAGDETLDSGGWGTQWSPDGKYIAWASGSNVTILSTETDEKTSLLTPGQQRQINHVYWNLGWSHDSKSIAFKSRSQAGKDTLAVADVDSEEGFQILLTADDIEEDVSWHSDNKHVFFSTTFEGTSKRRFALIARKPNAVPQLLEGIPDGWDVLNLDCSPDGTSIVFSGRPPLEPIEWKKP